MKSYREIYKPENQGKKFAIHCPNCKSRKINGSAIFLYCLDCCWVGQICEVLFGKEEGE